MACNIHLAKRKLLEVEETEWRDEMSKKPKLSLYRQIKSRKSTENYLQMNISRLERSLFSQIRFGILPFEIEVGRYRQKPVEERFCYHCKDEAEDEFHFLFSCKAQKNLRNYLPILSVRYFKIIVGPVHHQFLPNIMGNYRQIGW